MPENRVKADCDLHQRSVFAGISNHNQCQQGCHHQQGKQDQNGKGERTGVKPRQGATLARPAVLHVPRRPHDVEVWSSEPRQQQADIRMVVS